MKPREKAAMMGATGDRDSFGDGLAAAARSIIADARRALADSELSHPGSNTSLNTSNTVSPITATRNVCL